MPKPNKLICETQYIIRPVKKEDSKRIWQIRNHSLVRKYSALDTERIPLKKYKIWFEDYLKNRNNLCYVLEKKGRVLGYCRFDTRKDGKRRISIAVEPKFHGRGLGNYLLSNSIKKLRNKKNLIANIRRDNKVSFPLFQKNNFKIYKEDRKNYYLKYNSQSI